MNCVRSFFCTDDLSLRKRRLLLCMGFLLACIVWFTLGAVIEASPTNPINLYLWGWFWIVPVISLLLFLRLLKTRQCQSA
jgi:membrane protein DedA with SNARE-associated domain